MKLYSLIITLATLFLFCNSGFSQKAETFKDGIYYIVRHAEKDTGSNPPLSKIGQERAGDLYRKLKNKKIDLIFATQYPRTGMTADSLRIYQKIDSVNYKADLTGNDIFKKINERSGTAKHILIVGHSNTLPGIIRRAGVKSFTLKGIADEDYQHLYIIKIKKGKIKFSETVYGKL